MDLVRTRRDAGQDSTTRAPAAAWVYAGVVGSIYATAIWGRGLNGSDRAVLTLDHDRSAFIWQLVSIAVVVGVVRGSGLARAVGSAFHMLATVALLVLASAPLVPQLALLLGLQVVALGALLSPSLHRHCSARPTGQPRSG